MNPEAPQLFENQHKDLQITEQEFAIMETPTLEALNLQMILFAQNQQMQHLDNLSSQVETAQETFGRATLEWKEISDPETVASGSQETDYGAQAQSLQKAKQQARILQNEHEANQALLEVNFRELRDNTVRTYIDHGGTPIPPGMTEYLQDVQREGSQEQLDFTTFTTLIFAQVIANGNEPDSDSAIVFQPEEVIEKTQETESIPSTFTSWLDFFQSEKNLKDLKTLYYNTIRTIVKALPDEFGPFISEGKINYLDAAEHMFFITVSQVNTAFNPRDSRTKPNINRILSIVARIIRGQFTHPRHFDKLSEKIRHEAGFDDVVISDLSELQLDRLIEPHEPYVQPDKIVISEDKGAQTDEISEKFDSFPSDEETIRRYIQYAVKTIKQLATNDGYHITESMSSAHVTCITKITATIQDKLRENGTVVPSGKEIQVGSKPIDGYTLSDMVKLLVFKEFPKPGLGRAKLKKVMKIFDKEYINMFSTNSSNPPEIKM